VAEPLKVEFSVPDDSAGMRLDQALAKHVPELSRRKARVLLDIGGVFVDGARVKVAGRKVRPGQRVVAHLGGALDRAGGRTGKQARARVERELPPHRVVFEDAHLVIAFKPAGLLTAPTPESDRNNLADLLSRRGDEPPVMVVHRLDLQTSGLLAFAKTDAANRALSELFRVHDVEREYVAAVAGDVAEASRTLEDPVGGKRAVTHAAVLERVGRTGEPARFTVLSCRLETGRTHQIRIHCRNWGHSVLGDRRYGGRNRFDPPRMALHARTLGFAHPVTGETLRFEEPLPDELATWLDAQRRDLGSP